MGRERAIFYLNGVRVEVGPDQGRMMLADFLRYHQGLTGTKIVCAEGDCGACTVLRHNGKVFVPINSCIYRVAQVDGSALVSVEGLAKEGELAPAQRELMNAHGSQCGFCTPGFVMALAGLAEERIHAKRWGGISSKEAQNALTGNLCRCTGYEPILEAARNLKLEPHDSLGARYASPKIKAELKALRRQPLVLKSEEFHFFAPTRLKEVTPFLKKGGRILAAGTDLGVFANKGRLESTPYLSLHLMEELHQVTLTKTKVRVGAAVTLTTLREQIKKSIPEVARFLDRFASPQIKNVATLAGNVANASPIADCPPFLLALNGQVHMMGPRGKRVLGLEDFFKGYRQTALKSGEFIVAIEFDIPGADEQFNLYKISQRVDLDIATVNAAFRLRRQGEKVIDLHVAYGGIAATPLRLRKTESLLRGKVWDAELLDRAVAGLHQEITPISDLRGSAAFRRVVSENLLRRFFAGAT